MGKKYASGSREISGYILISWIYQNRVKFIMYMNNFFQKIITMTICNTLNDHRVVDWLRKKWKKKSRSTIGRTKCKKISKFLSFSVYKLMEMEWTDEQIECEKRRRQMLSKVDSNNQTNHIASKWKRWVWAWRSFLSSCFSRKCRTPMRINKITHMHTMTRLPMGKR